MTITINIDQEDFENLQRDVEMLHAENALKLTQILDLEQLLYDVRICDIDEGNSPCWCGMAYEEGDIHEETCNKARKVTKPFWKR